jgi:hypothetical protein
MPHYLFYKGIPHPVEDLEITIEQIFDIASHNSNKLSEYFYEIPWLFPVCKRSGDEERYPMERAETELFKNDPSVFMIIHPNEEIIMFCFFFPNNRS